MYAKNVLFFFSMISLFHNFFTCSFLYMTYDKMEFCIFHESHVHAILSMYCHQMAMIRLQVCKELRPATTLNHFKEISINSIKNNFSSYHHLLPDHRIFCLEIVQALHMAENHSMCPFYYLASRERKDVI